MTQSENFKGAVNRIRECPTRTDIARVLGISIYSVRQALLPETSDNFRTPPGHWRIGLASLARDRARALMALAQEIDGQNFKITRNSVLPDLAPTDQLERGG